MPDPYELLAVPRSATADDVKKSFRELAKRLHPDANNNNPYACALFAELNAAHQILGDEEKRRAFDRGEIDAEGKPTHRAIARHSRPSTWHIVTRLMVVMVMLVAASVLIMRGLTPEEKIDASSDGPDRVLSRVGANEEHAPAAQPEQSATAALTDQNAIQHPTDAVAVSETSAMASAALTDQNVIQHSADKTLASGAPADQNAMPHATDSRQDHESIELPIGRGEKLLSEGEGEAARILLQPAADAHDARAALALGAPYDPIMLAILQARGVAADVSLTRDWYKNASEFAPREAPGRLNLLASAPTDGGESVAVGSTKIVRHVEPGTPAKETTTAVALAKPKRHAVRRPIHARATSHLRAPPWDSDAVYGAVPDTSIRVQLTRDDGGKLHFFGVSY